jgi:hypothetical protein
LSVNHCFMKPMIWMVLLEWFAKLIAGVGAVVAVLVAVFNYRAQTKIKQAEWLKSLFEKFLKHLDIRKQEFGWIMENCMISSMSATKRKE